MSKSVKRFLPVVASIAIPFAAPAIVSSFAASGALGGTLTAALGTKAGFAAGSALTGAALGAATSTVTGQRMGKAALMGGIGGGMGGYLNAPTAATGNPVAGAPVNYGAGAASQAPTTGSINATLGAPSSTFSPIASTGTSGVTGSLVTPAAQIGTQAGPQAGVNLTQQQPDTFWGSVKQVPGRIMDRVTDPEVLADATLRAGAQLAGSAIAGDGLTAEQRQLMDQQRAELEWLQENNEAEYERRMQEAERLLGQSRYFDPEYFGMQAANRQLVSGSIAEREGLRGLSGARREAEERRYRLGTARNVGTAYDVGYQQGVQGQINLTQAGLNAMPRANQFTALGSYGPLMSAYGGAEDRRRQEQRDIGSFFTQLTTRPQDLDDEEEEARRAGLFAGGN